MSKKMSLGSGALRVGAACAVAFFLVVPTEAAERDATEAKFWAGTWAAAPQPFIPGNLENYHNQTLRLIVHTSIAGAMLFGGRPSTTVPPGAVGVSDPVSIAVPALSDLAVSIFLPASTQATTSHFLAQQVSYVSPEIGDLTAAVAFPVAKTITSWPFLTGVDVMATRNTPVVVAFGDSTVDGDGIATDSNQRWPDILAARLQASGTVTAGVLNEGLIGNQLLQNSPAEVAKQFGAALGQAGTIRFARDALGQSGVRCVIVRLGINDIGFPGALTPAATRMSAEQLKAGYRQLISDAHAKAIRIIGATLSPFEGTDVFPGYYTPEKEAIRQEINAWIRGSHEFDAVIDFDAVLRDPAHPSRLLPDYDSGDHLHTNEAGYAAAAKAIPLELLRVSLVGNEAPYPSPPLEGTRHTGAD